ncbi:MAG: helix-turn-helix domain-containing protein [bacterium]
MDDLEKYISKRKKKSSAFGKSFEVGYENFRIGFILRQAREELGITQEEVAKKLRTKKSAISRIENHAEDIRLSTLNRYAKALGRRLHVVMQ